MWREEPPLPCLREGPRPLPGSRLLWLAGMGSGCTLALKENVSSNSSSCCCRGSDSQRIPKPFPSFLPFFQKPLSRCPSSNHARATVLSATRSPEPARAGDFSSQGRREVLGPPRPTSLADRAVWGNSSTNSMTRDLKARAPTPLHFPNPEGKERVMSPITQS